MDEDRETKPMGQVIQIEEARIKDHLGEMVRGTMEEALNAILDAEANRLCVLVATSAQKGVRIREPATTRVVSRRRQARWS